MEKDFKLFLKKTCTDHARAVVGRILNQRDILEKDKSLSDKQRFESLSKFNRELVYEEFRDINNAIVFYAEGREYTKYPIFNPTIETK